MPYIKPEDRKPIDDALKLLPILQKPGEVNYTVTKVLVHYLEEHGLTYHTINDLIGVLECAKMELYRRLAAPYETNKCIQNGDAYPHEF